MKESNEIVENYVRSLQPDITDAEMEVLVNDFFENENTRYAPKNINEVLLKSDGELEKSSLVLEKDFYLFLKNKIEENEKIEKKGIAFLDDENLEELKIEQSDIAKVEEKEIDNAHLNLNSNNLIESINQNEIESSKINLDNKGKKKTEASISHSKRFRIFNLFGSVLGIFAFIFFIGLLSTISFGLYKFYKISNSSEEKNKVLEKFINHTDTIVVNKIPDSEINKRNKVEENVVNLKADTEIVLKKNNTILKFKNSDKVVVKNEVQGTKESKKNLTKLSNVRNTKNLKEEDNLVAVNIQPVKISKLAEANEPSEKLEPIKIVKKPMHEIERNTKPKIIFSKYD